MEEPRSAPLDSPEEPLILLVEDAPDQLKALAKWLKGIPCRLIKASSGAQTLAIAFKEKPDLVLLDQYLPDMDGCEVLRALQREPGTKDGSVILLLEKADPENITLCLAAGAVDTLAKPILGTELLARVKIQLDLQHARNREKKLLAELNAVTSEIQVLSGLVPICAHCKKIRNDNGFWQQVDDYVSRRSAIQFSHGLCPECIPKYFPDFRPPLVNMAKQPDKQTSSAELSKILVVDDSPSTLQTLIQYLREDYEILAATSGPVALEMALQEQPALILLDVVMPDMDGHEVCLKLKEDPRTRNIPVIFVTAESEEGCELKGFDMGAVDYITKPFTLSILHARIETHLELKRFRDDLERQSMTDGLTGIPNRRYLERFLELFWHQAIRLRLPISVILMDVDFFKTYNDQYGHLAGDDCLKRVVQALEKAVQRKADFLARYGGEEFMCVLLGTDKAGAQQVAERLRQSIQALAIPHVESYVANHVTISLGIVSSTPAPEDNLNDLLAKADQALGEAKKRGRNRCYLAGAK